MVKNNKETAEDTFEQVESALSRSEQYIEENQKSLLIIVAAIILIVGIYLSYNRFYLAPKEKDAQSQMYVAEQYFEKDSFRLALHGDGNYIGFESIIADYGVTKSANLANYYAGICNLQLGNFNEAIDFLKQFSSDDKMLAPIALGAIGDSYFELENNKEAINFYMKAANTDKNQFTAPIYLQKAGQAYESEGNFAKAIEVYETIQSDYSKTTEGRQVEKYISRAKMKMNK